MEFINIPEKYKKFIKLDLYKKVSNKGVYLITFISQSTNKLKSVYKNFQKFLSFYLNKNFKNKKKIYIKFEADFKLKQKILLVYSILNSIEIEKMVDEGVKLKFEIKEGIKFIYNQYEIYIWSKRKINNDLCLFISDYLIPRKYTTAYMNNEKINFEESNNLFFSTVGNLISAGKNKNGVSVRLPQFYIMDSEEMDKFFKSIENLSDLKYVGINLIYHEDIKNNCNPNYFEIYIYFCKILIEIFRIFKFSTCLINFLIANVDECFPLHYLFNYLTNNLPLTENKRFVVNLRSLSYLNHPLIEIYGGENLIHADSIFNVGKSIYINKFLCRLENLDKIYLLFLIIKRKYSNLGKKIIMLLIGNFLVDFNFYDFDKVPSYLPDENKSSLKNDLKNFPRQVRNIFKLNESLSDTKLIVFGNNYNPLDK